MKKIISFLYKKFPVQFSQVMVEELMGHLPEKVTEPSNTFFASAGRKIEAWILHRSWVIQQKMLSDPQNGPYYMGRIFELKTIMFLIAQKPIRMVDSPPPIIKEEKDPFEGVTAFRKKMV